MKATRLAWIALVFSLAGACLTGFNQFVLKPAAIASDEQSITIGHNSLLKWPVSSIVGLNIVGGYTIQLQDDEGLAEESVGIRIGPWSFPLTKFWRIRMPCGQTVVYPLNALPEVDTPCPCGDQAHWLVKYEDRQ